MIFGKSAQMGEGILLIYRLILLSFIVLIIMGVATIFYSYYIDVRDAEGIIMAREIVNCVSPDGIFDNSLSGDVLESCGYASNERYYVNVSLFDSSGKFVKRLESGDSSSKWVLEIYKSQKAAERIAKYEPGYFNKNYDVLIDEAGILKDAKLNIEVLVQHEL